MKKNDIIRMAQAAGINTHHFDVGTKELERFAALVAAHEREACAKVCDELQDVPATEPHHCPEDIRARGNK